MLKSELCMELFLSFEKKIGWLMIKYQGLHTRCQSRNLLETIKGLKFTQKKINDKLSLHVLSRIYISNVLLSFSKQNRENMLYICPFGFKSVCPCVFWFWGLRSRSRCLWRLYRLKSVRCVLIDILYRR